MFWILWAFDALILAVFLFFFVVGLGDGSVSSFNMTLWLVTLAILGGIVGSGVALRSKGRARLATTVLLVLAVPGLLFVSYFLIVFASNPRWN